MFFIIIISVGALGGGRKIYENWDDIQSGNEPCKLNGFNVIIINIEIEIDIDRALSAEWNETYSSLFPKIFSIFIFGPMNKENAF